MTQTTIQYGSRTLDLSEVTPDGAWELGWEMYLICEHWQQNPFQDKYSQQYEEWADGYREAQDEYGRSGKGSKKLPDSCPICGSNLQKPDGNCKNKQCWW